MKTICLAMILAAATQAVMIKENSIQQQLSQVDANADVNADANAEYDSCDYCGPSPLGECAGLLQPPGACGVDVCTCPCFYYKNYGDMGGGWNHH